MHSLSEQIDQLFDSNLNSGIKKYHSSEEIRCELFRNNYPIFNDEFLFETSPKGQELADRFHVQHISHSDCLVNTNRFHVKLIPHANHFNCPNRFHVQHIPHSNSLTSSNRFSVQHIPHAKISNHSNCFSAQYTPHSSNQKCSDEICL
jgi:hypothetical protein